MGFMKKIKMVVLILAVILIFTGCSTASKNSSDNGSSPSGESAEADTSKTEDTTGGKKAVNLTIWLAGSGDAIYDTAYRTVLDAYCKENPNVTYELTFIPWTDYFTKLNTGLIGGAGPDIFMLGYGQMGSIQDLGYCLNLDQYIPEDWDGYDDFYENVLKSGYKDGSLYGLFAPSTRVWEYRKDIAEANGVTEEELYIKTPDDFYNLVRKMTVYDDSGKVKTYGLELDPDGEQDFFALTSMYDEELALWNDDLTAAFNKEASAKALDGMKALIEEGVVCFRDPSATIFGVAAGTAAMDLTAETNYAVSEAAYPGNIGIVKNDMNTLLIGNYLAVNAASRNPDTAAEVFLHLYSKESQQVLAEKAALYSGRKSLDDAYLELNPEFENVIYAYQKSYPYSFTMNKLYSTVIVDFRTGMELIIKGADSVSTLEDMEAQWNSVIATADK